VFPPNNVSDTYFGTVVDDPYRALENVKDPQVLAWMKAQAAHAERTLTGLAGYPRLLAQVGRMYIHTVLAYSRPAWKPRPRSPR